MLRACHNFADLATLIWAFTESNFTTFVLPNTLFGLFAVLAAPTLTESTEAPSMRLLVIRGIPRMLVANWANVFIFDLFNQRSAESVREDSFNKPWRPLPQGQLRSPQAERLLRAAIPVVLGLSACLGVGIESTIALVLSWTYCDLKGGDRLTRDFHISLGYSVAFVASLRLGLADDNVRLSATGYRWLGMMMGVIVTTMQVQDLKDHVGDQARGRQTWPLVVGHRVSRWWVAAWLLFWSVACSLFWRLPGWAAAVSVGVGRCVAGCVLAEKDDARAWRLWCGWQVCLYSCPVVAQFLGLI
jgi:hypothetical protein